MAVKGYLAANAIAQLIGADNIKNKSGAMISPSSEGGYLNSSGKAWNFEDGTATGWTTYADAAAVSPVDGTGGSPNVTFAASASSPLRGLYSGLLTKDAANRQGQGVSVDFTLDSQDTGKPFTLNVDCSASAAYTGSSGTEYARVYVYDVTNSKLLDGYIDIALGSSTCKGFFLATTSTSYRLIFHIAGTGTSAWTLKVDTVVVGQQTLGFGQVTTDWQAYTPTFNGLGTVTGIVARWRRVGDSIQICGTFTTGTVSGSGIAYMSLPNSYQINTTIVSSNRGFQLGTFSKLSSTAQNIWDAQQSGSLTYDSTAGAGNLLFAVQVDAGSYRSTTPNNIFNSTENHSFISEMIPINGLSSNIIAGDRAVEEYAYNTSVSDSDDTTSFGNGAAGNTVVGALTAARKKRIRFQTPVQETDSLIIEFKDTSITTAKWVPIGDFVLNSVNVIQPLHFQNTNSYGVGLIPVNSTDYDVYFARYPSSTGTTFGAAGAAWTDSTFQNVKWRVRKVSGGALVGYPIDLANITNKHVMVARMSGAQSTAAATDVKVAFDTIEIDTAGTYSTTNRRYTIPVSGIYRAHIYFNVDSVTAANALYCKLYKNATTFVQATKWEIPSSGLQNPIQLTWVGQLLAGDFLEAYVRHDDGSARNITFTSQANTPIFTVERVT